MKRTLLASLVVMLGALLGPEAPAMAQGWQPPIGIPAPGFGITNTAPPLPTPWTGNVPGFYYVQSGGGNSGNGYPGSPRATIPSSLPAGSVVVVSGTYTTDHGDVPIAANGTAANPVYIRGFSETQRPTIRRSLNIRGQYWVIEYIDLRPQPSLWGAILVENTHHGVVRHSDIAGDGQTTAGGIYVGASTDIVIWNNAVHDGGDVNATYDQDKHCIVISTGSSIWVIDNELTRCSGDGIQLNAGANNNAALHHVYVGRNNAHHNKQAGFWTKQAQDVIFSENVSHSHRSSDSSSGQCMGGQYSPGYVWFIANHIFDCESGIRLESDDRGNGTDTFYIGNLIHDITSSSDGTNPHGPGAIVLRGGVNRWVVNNTIWSYQAGVMSPSGVGFVHMENNVLGGRTSSQGRDIYLELPVVANNSTMRNNLLGPGSRIQWSDAVYSSLSAFRAGTGKGQDSVTADPLFINVQDRDFRLQPGSPGIDRGIASPVYGIFMSRYGIDISRDLVGTARPQGLGIELGAFEVSSGGQGPPPVPGLPPAAPSGLTVR